MNILKILVVDDKKVIGDLFEFTLGYSGHIITVVDNASAAIEAVKNKEFDIAFIDIVMPVKDGVELLSEIRGAASRLPIVMMSGYSVEDKKRQARNLGAVTCLKKPFDIDDVKKIIKAVTGKDV
ncbi:MAG: response regulator [Candidatus Omnitrophota bacterium]